MQGSTAHKAVTCRTVSTTQLLPTKSRMMKRLTRHAGGKFQREEAGVEVEVVVEVRVVEVVDEDGEEVVEGEAQEEVEVVLVAVMVVVVVVVVVEGEVKEEGKVVL